jgi:hypothetical protein
MSDIEHPLPAGTKAIADTSCSHCNLGYNEQNPQLQVVTITNHSVVDGVIRYKAREIPISQFLLAEDIQAIIEEDNDTSSTPPS